MSRHPYAFTKDEAEVSGVACRAYVWRRKGATSYIVVYRDTHARFLCWRLLYFFYEIALLAGELNRHRYLGI